MLTVTPSYYKTFCCIADACIHNCCIGWEIDIDKDTCARYQAEAGTFGDRLRTQIEGDDPPHFRLGDRERCPFLNERNLCDIILNLGEDALCTICTEHPRFHNELPGRIESGLGLCCEEAARLILGQTDPVALCISGTDEGIEDDILALRDEILIILQDRTLSIPDRIARMLARCDTDMPDTSIAQLAAFCLSLEQLDEAWTSLLTRLQTHPPVNTASFDRHMVSRQTEYEQFLVYLVYRHMANAPDEREAAARACFAAFGYRLLHDLGAMLYAEQGDFTFANQTELARLFSAEIEYAQENTDAVLDMLYTE